MIKHSLCRPPAGVKIVATLLPPAGRSPGRFQKGDAGRPALAFLGKDKNDETSANIWIPDCACTGNPRCPRTRALAWAAGRFDSTSVISRRATSTPRRKRRR